MNFESVENVQSSNVVEYEFVLRHIPTSDICWQLQTTEQQQKSVAVVFMCVMG